MQFEAHHELLDLLRGIAGEAEIELEALELHRAEPQRRQGRETDAPAASTAIIHGNARARVTVATGARAPVLV